MIKVQTEDFDVNEHYRALAQNEKAGAVVFFVGLVRDYSTNQDSLGKQVTGLTLEHYPAMTEKALKKIVDEAQSRWQLGDVRVIHRVGALDLNDQIVFVGVSSRHREASFEACQFIMDYLKNKAPFWKKERTLVEGKSQDKWIETQAKDKESLNRWTLSATKVEE